MAGIPAKIAIIGSGQIGTSLALAMNEKMPETLVAAFDNDPAIAAELANVLKDSNAAAVTIAATLANAVREADIIILATPIDRFGDVLRDSRADLKQGAVITDVGSGKQKAIAQIMAALPHGTSYVPAHPANGKAGKGLAGFIQKPWLPADLLSVVRKALEGRSREATDSAEG